MFLGIPSTTKLLVNLPSVAQLYAIKMLLKTQFDIILILLQILTEA